MNFEAIKLKALTPQPNKKRTILSELSEICFQNTNSKYFNPNKPVFRGQSRREKAKYIAKFLVAQQFCKNNELDKYGVDLYRNVQKEVIQTVTPKNVGQHGSLGFHSPLHGIDRNKPYNTALFPTQNPYQYINPKYPKPPNNWHPPLAIDHNESQNFIPPTNVQMDVDNTLSDEDNDINMDEDQIAPEVRIPNISRPSVLRMQKIDNIFYNHPHFNTTNKQYRQLLNQYIEQHNVDKNNNVTMVIPTNVINIPIVAPDDITISAAADTGSDIQAIGIKTIIKYKNKGLIKYDKKGQIIGTGNGAIHVHNYLPVTVVTHKGNKINTKFWCLESLPNFDWLVGNTLLHQLGYQLVNKYEEYIHKPHTIDHVDHELDELLCSQYPVKNEPNIDISKIYVKPDKLRSFVHNLLNKHQNNLAKHEFDSGKITKKEFSIDFIQENHPLKAGFMTKEYWMKPEDKIEVQIQLDGLMDNDLIELCPKPQYVSSLFCVSKKTGDIRIVFDYRRLNLITQKLQFPIPRTSELLRKFIGKNYITSLDMKGGYWHIPVKPEDRHKLAFVFDGIVYQWKVMPFGPTNSPMFFQQAMQEIFGKLDYVTVYIDDISILSDTVEEHKRHLTEVFKLLEQHCIKLRLDKCIWGAQDSEYLGFVVNKYGVCPKPDYIQKILNVPKPKTKQKLQRFIGLVQYLHHFIPQLQIHLKELTPLTGSTAPKIINFTDIQSNAFNEIKSMIMNTKTLRHPDISKPFHVFTDASKYGLGGMLAQHDENGKLTPVSYCSKVFNETQQRWHVSEQEIYAAIYCIEKWSHVLQYKQFILHTDHKNLQTLFEKALNFKTGKLFRWAVRLQDYDFKCQYIKGSDNIIADYLSRESVEQLLPQNKCVKDFYDSNPYPSESRKTLSENDGIDILQLYTNHLMIQSLNTNTIGHYFESEDPFKLLLQQKYQPNIARKTHLLQLKMDTNYNSNNNPHKNIPYWPTDYFKIKPEIQRYIQRPYNAYLNLRNLLPNKDMHRNERNTNNPYTVSYADDYKYDNDELINESYQQLENISSPAPYIAPIDPLVPNSINRRSERLRLKGLKHNKPKHIKLVIGRPVTVSSITLKNHKQARERRKFLRDQQKQLNQQIIDDKPYNLAWNASLLMPKYNVPIHSYYGNALSKSNHLQRNLIRLKQGYDPLCYNVINFLQEGNRALLEDIPKYLKRYVLSGRYNINTAGILTFKHRYGDREIPLKERDLIVLPSPLRASVLKYAHSKFHHGTTKMRQIIIKLGYWWPKMNQHINAHTSTCPACQYNKGGSHRMWKNTNRMKLFPATKPFQQISVDIVGPLPMSFSQNRYIVTIIDKFSRYCMLIPVETITSIDIVKAIDKWITLFGPPESILSDNGPQFISAIYKDYIENSKDNPGVKRKYTSTYYPCCNGQIERLHRWIKERLTLIAFDGGLNFVDGDDDWSDYLGIIQYTYNSTPNLLTGYSPMNIVLGNDAYEIPTEIKFDPSLPEEYIRYMSQRQAIIRAKANKQQQKYDEARKRNYDKNRKTPKKDYKIKQKVLYNIHTHFTGNRRKLGPKWVGPFEIVDILEGKQSFKLKVIPLPAFARDNPMNKFTIPKRGNKEEDNEQFIVNRSQIKPYYEAFEERFDGIQSPAQIALLHSYTAIEEANKSEQNMLLCTTPYVPLTNELDKAIQNAELLRNKLYQFQSTYEMKLNDCPHAYECNRNCPNEFITYQQNIGTLIKFHTFNNVM